MSDLSVSERRIRPIQDAVGAGNWKQALQLCDKWQKKGEKSDRFLALKASILVNQADISHREKGRTETLQLCRRSVPVTDIEAIYQLQDSLKHLSLYKDEGSKLWERATATLPNDKDFLTTWLNGSLSEDNWLMAQKAAMALRKAFPKERQYDFLNILLCYLVHQDDQLPEKDRMLFGTLAYRLMSKAAEMVPDDETQLLTTGKAISTPEELALLTRIYTSTGHEDEAVVLLRNGKLGLTSKVAEHDPQMVFSLLIEALDCSQQHEVVLECCQKMLTTDDGRSKEYAEDDRLWRTISRLAQANNARLLEPCLELVDTTLQKHPRCREIHVAELDLLKQAVRVNIDRRTDLLTACQQYLEIFESKPFCFGDIADALKICQTNSVHGVAGNAYSSDVSEAQRVLGLKLDYSTLSEASSTEVDFLQFVTKAVKLHKTLPKHKTECPELMLLAALALIRLAAKSQNIGYLLQASFMLEYTISKHTEYYPLAVRLIQLYRVLGLMSLAMERFGSLSVKNIQWETVGHLLLTRISSLHPLQCDVAGNIFSPLGAFDAGLNMLINAEKSLDQQIKKGLEYGSYSNVLDSVMVKHNITASINRQMFGVEERKIQALVDLPIDIMFDEYPSEMVDRRDFAFLETYGVEDGALNAVLNCGPLPQASWLDTMVLWDHIAVMLTFENGGRTPEAEKVTTAFSKLWSRVGNTSRPDLTNAEMSSNSCYHAVGGILIALQQSPKEQQTEVDTHLDTITSWLGKREETDIAVVNGIRIPTWRFLHLCFTRLQTLQSLSLLITFLSRKTKSKSTKNLTMSKDAVTGLKKAVIEAEKAIHQSTRDLKAAINAPGVLGKLIEVVGGRLEEGSSSALAEYKALAEEFAEVYEELALEEYCGRMKDSWEDALNGILAIKVKMDK